MRFDVFTIFPQVFDPYLGSSILKRAKDRGLVDFHIHNIRDWTSDKHHTTDDEPYGGGGGMVMKAEPVFSAVYDVLGNPPNCPILLLTPQGRKFDQRIALDLSSEPRIGLIAGRYEGIDERVRKHLVTDEISIGDYVLTGGELPALVVIDSVTRLIPNVLGDSDAPKKDSHASGLLEYPHYTRPAVFWGWEVPEVLRTGNHSMIDRWRKEQSIKRTLERRPDLLEQADLTETDREYIKKLLDERKDHD
jgi:tRNA (guanine37-N1)-methyltransferase